MGLTKRRDKNACSFFSPSELNNYFITVSSSHPACSTSELNNILLLPSNPLYPLFTFSQVTPEQVKSLLEKSVTSSNRISPDNLPLQYISKFIDTICPYLTDIFNLAICSNTYPEAWKFAHVIPLLP